MTLADRVLISIGLGFGAIMIGIGVRAGVRGWLAEREKRRQVAEAVAKVKARRDADSATQRPVLDLSGVQDPLGAATVALADADPPWRVIQAAGCVNASRGWPDGTVDTAVLFATSGYADRQDPSGSAVLWTVKGSLEHVVNSALTVPAPDAPDAPHGSGTAVPRGEWR